MLGANTIYNCLVSTFNRTKLVATVSTSGFDGKTIALKETPKLRTAK